jgi:hypothetical protein
MARQGKTQAASYTSFAASSVEGEPVRKTAVAGHYLARLHCGANDAVLNTRAPRILGRCVRHKCVADLHEW